MDYPMDDTQAVINRSEEPSSETAARGAQFFDEACATLGLSEDVYAPDPRLWSEMREEAIEERLSERFQAK